MEFKNHFNYSGNSSKVKTLKSFILNFTFIVSTIISPGNKLNASDKNNTIVKNTSIDVNNILTLTEAQKTNISEMLKNFYELLKLNIYLLGSEKREIKLGTNLTNHLAEIFIKDGSLNNDFEINEINYFYFLNKQNLEDFYNFMVNNFLEKGLRLKMIDKEELLKWLKSFNNVMVQSGVFTIDESKNKQEEFSEKLIRYKNNEILKDVYQMRIDFKKTVNEIGLTYKEKIKLRENKKKKIHIKKSDFETENLLKIIDETILEIKELSKSKNNKEIKSLASMYNDFLNFYKIILNRNMKKSVK